MWYRLLELLAHLYGYTLEYSLYRLTFAQALALIDTHNERERKAQEAAEAAAHADDPNYVNPDKYNVSRMKPEELPTMDELQAAFGALMA